MNILPDLVRANTIHPPKWLPDNTAYLCYMGSHAYGVADDDSDLDVYGFCIPPIDVVFPHLDGEIPGFGSQVQRFEQWQEHHAKAPGKDAVYDFSVYSIVKYFQLAMQNNPNMIDSLFVPRRCILHSTPLSEHLREHRRLFLHKGSWHKFKGYAYSQMSKIKGKVNAASPRRATSIQTHGYDVKFAYHLVRLLCEVEQIMVEGDLDLEKNTPQLRSIRRGEWTLPFLEAWFSDKEKALETVYASSSLQHSPDEAVIRQLLLECLEMHYGSLDSVVKKDPSADRLVSVIRTAIETYEKARS